MVRQTELKENPAWAKDRQEVKEVLADGDQTDHSSGIDHEFIDRLSSNGCLGLEWCTRQSVHDHLSGPSD